MPAMVFFTAEIVVLKIVGAASAANRSHLYSRLKPLPQNFILPPFIAGMARSTSAPMMKS